jgi:hypothetical protein
MNRIDEFLTVEVENTRKGFIGNAISSMPEPLGLP